MNESSATYTAHVDSFARDNLPPRELWPDFALDRPPLSDYPARLNCAVELLDRMVEQGHRDRPAFLLGDAVWTYGDVLAKANQVARVLVEEMGLVPGNRVLLRGPNNPMLVAAWMGVVKAGGICVATMPLLRARELTYICDKAAVTHALCDARMAEELELAREQAKTLGKVMLYSPLGDGEASLDRAMAAKPVTFDNVQTAADDVVLIAFTSGTTGPAKGTMHFHRDVLAMCDCFPKLIEIGPDDRFTGSPPLAFTFGLGALCAFPMRYGASVAFVERPSPEALLQTIQQHRCTGLYTAPTMYRAMTELAKGYDLSSLKKCVSAGEHLPLPTSNGWAEATGIRIVDGIGSTEMLHIFISAAGADIRPGSTGKAIFGYEAKIVDDEGRDVPPNTPGRLAVRGATGCRYLDNLERQRGYVSNGWNLTGDLYSMDEDGYFWYGARADDMIISAGYNISGPEIEEVLMEHPKVRECAVVGLPDDERGAVVAAFVVLRDHGQAGPDLVKELQDHVKAHIAPYKYPRRVEFLEALPRTETGKLQRFRLRQAEPVTR